MTKGSVIMKKVQFTLDYGRKKKDGKDYSTGKRNLSVVRAKAVYEKLRSKHRSNDL